MEVPSGIRMAARAQSTMAWWNRRPWLHLQEKKFLFWIIKGCSVTKRCRHARASKSLDKLWCVSVSNATNNPILTMNEQMQCHTFQTICTHLRVWKSNFQNRIVLSWVVHGTEVRFVAQWSQVKCSNPLPTSFKLQTSPEPPASFKVLQSFFRYL